MKTITVSQIKTLLATHAGKFFALDFIKKDGSHRHMVCRTGVAAYVKGSGRNFKTPELYLSVWDALAPEKGDKAYRTVILDSIFKIKVAGNVYDVTR